MKNGIVHGILIDLGKKPRKANAINLMWGWFFNAISRHGDDDWGWSNWLNPT